MRKYFIILFLLPSISFSQLYKVNAEGGLNVRESPGGKKIATILKDDIVYVQSRFYSLKDAQPLSISDIDKKTGESRVINGKWVQIKTLRPPKLKGDKILWNDNNDNVTGFIFNGFLEKLDDNDVFRDFIKDEFIHFDDENLDISNKCLIRNTDGSTFTGTTYYLQFLSDQYFKWRNEQILLKTISFVDGVKNGVSRVIDLETGKIIKEKSFDDKPISEELVKGTIKFEKILFDPGGDTYEGGIYLEGVEYISSEDLDEFKSLFETIEYHDWAIQDDYIDKTISISLKKVYNENIDLLGDSYEGAQIYFYDVFETEFCSNNVIILDAKIAERLDGKFESFYDNGQLKLQQYYDNGIKNGIHKSYSYTGELIYLRNYIDGKLDGLEIEKVGWGTTEDWYLDSTYWKHGEKHGIKKSYRLKDGSSNLNERIIRYEEHWENGTNELTKWYHSNGKVQSEGKWAKLDYPVGIHKKYYFNGQLESEGELNGYGTNNYYKHEGRHVKYSQYGEIVDVKFYKNDIEINRTSTNKLVGTYSFGDNECENGCGELLIHPNSDGSLQFYLSVNRGAPNYNSGAVRGNLLMSKPNTYIFSSNHFGACGLSFELNDIIMIVKTMENRNNCGFGYNVSADGQYKLLNNFIPEYFTNGEGSKILF